MHVDQDSDTGAVALCALRYCMGRRTYMPSLVIEWVRKHWYIFSDNDKTRFIKDLEDQFDSIKQFNDPGLLGDPHDVQNWETFYSWMKANV